MDAVRQIGVMGGTFDPIHYGHLAAAEEARFVMTLERVLFVVAGIPPHKLGEPISSAPDRLKMVELAISANPYFEISRVDLDRPGPSYSVETVELLRREWGAQAELYFILGLDSLAELPTWRDPQRLIQLCQLVAVKRPRYRIDMDHLERAIPGLSQRVHIIDMPEVDIAASDLQRRVREGMPIKYQVPPPVEEYIYTHRLYIDTHR